MEDTRMEYDNVNNHPKLKIRQNRTPDEAKVYKRHAYGLLKKLIQEGRFTTLRMTARSIGVRPETIQKWLRTPAIQHVLAKDVESHVQAIEKSKDWKAHAYLLEHIIDAEKREDTNSTTITVYTNKERYEIKK